MSDQDLIDEIKQKYIKAKKEAKPEEVVLYEVKDRIAFITLNDPGNCNRLEPDICNALGDAWIRFEKDTEAAIAILSANGPDFCLGADLQSSNLSALGRAFPPNGTRVLKPIIGALDGVVSGSGYGLALGTDITYATRDTHFIFPEVWVGIVGAVPRYVAYMPFKVSMEFLLSGQPMSAQRAYEIGLVNKVLSNKSELMDEAVRMADIIKKNAPLSLKAIKYGQYQVRETAVQRATREARDEFNTFIRPQLISEDYQEGINALLELREPEFKGK